jgi:CO/xanthine dehydrogenase FAD-binding subunit
VVVIEMSFGSPYLTLPDFQYLKPASLQEALQVLDEHKDDAKVMAGGVGLLAFMKERLVSPSYVVDIKGIPELETLSDEGPKGITIGATVTLSELLDWRPLRERYTAMYDCGAELSDPVLRNRSTLLGDLCEALPFVDSPTPLLIFDAEIEAASVKGRRLIPINEFIKGLAETALEPNEIAVAVHLKAPPDKARSIFLKHTSNSEFSVANVAALCANPSRAEDRIVRFAYGALAPMPDRVYEGEKIFNRKAPLPQLIDEAVQVIKKSVEPMTDILAKADYRSHILEVLAIEALGRVLGA